MAKKCKFERQKRQRKLIAQHQGKREALTDIIRDPQAETEQKLDAYRQLAKLPRDSAAIRFRNRCEITGRPRAVYRKFKLCRILLRDLAHEGQIPGVKKSSW